MEFDFIDNIKHEDCRRIWREPPDESTNIYQGLVVQDDRVGGSITVRRSRLPLWTLIGTAIREDWEAVEDAWGSVREYEYTAEELSEFAYNLLESRGEFARLILEIASANKEHDHWWTDEELKGKVRNQLAICLKSLSNDERPIQSPDTI